MYNITAVDTDEYLASHQDFPSSSKASGQTLDSGKAWEHVYLVNRFVMARITFLSLIVLKTAASMESA